MMIVRSLTSTVHPFARPIAITAAFLVAATLVASLPAIFMVIFGNSEFFSRGHQTIVIVPPAGADSPSATLVLHRLVPDENAIEASVLVSFGSEPSPLIHKPAASCAVVSVFDRSTQDDASTPGKLLQVACPAQHVLGYPSEETSRFLLPAHQSVLLYPLDNRTIAAFIDVTLPNRDKIRPFKVIKVFPTETMTWNENPVNWELTVGRSTNEIVVVSIGAVVFVALALFTSWHIAFGTKGNFGAQDVLAIAGFIVAAAGFRDMLGVTRTLGTSAFEIGVFVVPLLIMTCSVVVGQVRR